MPVRVSPFLCRFSMAGRCGHRPLRNITMRGANFPGRRGNRRSAASGRRSEAISRKCPDWQARRCLGIGWHDGGQPPTPTEGVTKGCDVRRDTWVPPYKALFSGQARVPCREGAVRAGRCGEQTERRQWRIQRSERVAAVKISSVRRKAAQKFWAPQQGHRLLRM